MHNLQFTMYNVQFTIYKGGNILQEAKIARRVISVFKMLWYSVLFEKWEFGSGSANSLIRAISTGQSRFNSWSK